MTASGIARWRPPPSSGSAIRPAPSRPCRDDIRTDERHATRLPPGQRPLGGGRPRHRSKTVASATPPCAICGCARGLPSRRAGTAGGMPMRSGRSGLSRRDALWAVRALAARRAIRTNCRCSPRRPMPQIEPDAALPPMLPGEQVVEDYRHLSLSLKAHPVSFLRDELDARRRHPAERAAERAAEPAERVTIAGLVLVRQRPGTAKGVIFMTLEDETGIANTIVWPKIFETLPSHRARRAARQRHRQLQNEKGVIHVVVDHIEDMTPLLRRLSEHGASIKRARQRRRGAPPAGRTPSPSALGQLARHHAERSARGTNREGDAQGAQF